MNTWHPGTLLDSLTPSDRVGFTELGACRKFAPGEVVVFEGDLTTGVYVLLAGTAKVVGSAGYGKAVLVDVRIAGELIGELAALDGDPRSSTVVAATQVSARFIGQAQFTRFLDEHPPAFRAVSRSMAAKLRRSTEHQLTLNVASPVIRLARVLLDLADRSGIPCKDGIRISVPLSHPELAGYIGMSQPSLQRAFAELRGRRAVITRYRTQIITDVGLLGQIAGATDGIA